MQAGIPNSNGQSALPFEFHRVCGSKMENTFSFCEIVSPLRRRRSIWSICRIACARKFLISMNFRAGTLFRANSGRTASMRRTLALRHPRWALMCIGLACRVLRTRLNRFLMDFCKCFHWRPPGTSCFEAAHPAFARLARERYPYGNLFPKLMP